MLDSHYGYGDCKVGSGFCDSESPHYVEVDVSQSQVKSDVFFEHSAD